MYETTHYKTSTARLKPRKQKVFAMRLSTAKSKLSPLFFQTCLSQTGFIMKRSLAIMGALGLMAWSANVATGANIFFNGNLDQIGQPNQDQVEATPLGWTTIAVKSTDGSYNDGGASKDFCNVVEPGGQGFFFKPFQGQVGPIPNLLNVYLYQENAATSNSLYTLSGYAAGEANFCAFFNTNVPAPKALFVIEFLDGGGAILASNAFDLVANGLPNTGAGLPMLGFHPTTPQAVAPFGTATVRAGAWLLNAYTTTGQQGFFVDGLDLELISPPGSPVITNQPQASTVSPGATAHFTVGVSNTAGVVYQWLLGNTTLSDGGNISGATTASLTVASVSTSDVGHYRVLVSNPSGSVYSVDAPLAIQVLNFFPAVTLNGRIKDTYRVDYATDIAPTTWVPLATNKLTTSPYYFFDTTSPVPSHRFYRSVFLF